MKKRLAIVLVVLALALSIGAAYAWATTSGTASPACITPTCASAAMHLYIDTHDKKDGTWPASISTADLNAFYGKYAAACQAEGVVIVRTYVDQQDGRAFCVNMAPSVNAVKRAHARVGLPYDGISEVHGVAPTDLLLNE
jgi:hypothetical protein